MVCGNIGERHGIFRRLLTLEPASLISYHLGPEISLYVDPPNSLPQFPGNFVSLNGTRALLIFEMAYSLSGTLVYTQSQKHLLAYIVSSHISVIVE